MPACTRSRFRSGDLAEPQHLHMASRPQSLLTPPRAPRAAPPNTATPNGLPRRRQVGHRLLDLGLPGGAAPPPEGGFPTPSHEGGVHASTAPPPRPPTAEALTALTDVPRAVHPLLDLGPKASRLFTRDPMDGES